jgi:anti-sigma28 factor (negative regulator of flagellin synthesis)
MMITEVKSVQSRPLPVKISNCKAPENLRTLRIARIKQQIGEGTYYVSGQKIALKFLLHEQLGGCCLT